MSGTPPPGQGGPPPEHGTPPPGQGAPPPGPGGQGPGGPGGDLSGVQPQADNDKLISALCYIFWFLVPIIILVTDMKDSRFAKVHAYQGLVFGAVGVVFYIIYGILWVVMTSILWFLACILWVGYFVPLLLGLYIAYKVYSQGAVEFPGLTDATKAVFKDL